MRALFWLLALTALAIGLALLGRLSDGYVLWVMPPWRIEVSLNLFVVALLAVLLLTYLLLRAVSATLDLPRRVADFRNRRARRNDDTAATEALRFFWEGRYAQALKSAAKVGAGATVGTPQGIAALVGLKSAHALRDEARIGEWQQRAEALDAAGWRTARLMAEMRIALDARDYAGARAALEQLGVKERRQISVQRLTLRLAQGQKDWAEMLRLARVLEKHGALTAEQARPLRLAAHRGMIETLQDDPAQLMRYWGGDQNLTAAEREDEQVIRRMVHTLAAAGACNESAQLVEEHLDAHWLPSLLEDYAICEGGDLVRRIAHAEKWLLDHPDDADLLRALGSLCMRQQLWGKARSYLEASLSIAPARDTHLELARLGDLLKDDAAANRHYRAAATKSQSQSRGGRKSV